MGNPVDIVVRRLLASDAPQYRAIRLDALRLAPEAFGGSFAEDADKTITEFVNSIERNTIFGAYDDAGALTGSVGMFVRSGEKLRHKGVLFGMFGVPTARGSGIGRALLDRVIEEARRHVEELQLSVVTTNAAAVRLYAEAGFREYGLEHRALKIGDRYIDERLMALVFNRS